VLQATRGWRNRCCSRRKPRGDYQAATLKNNIAVNGLQTWVLDDCVKSVAARVEEPEEYLQAVPDPTEELRRDQNLVVAPDQVPDRGLE
jgi:hypothetical protein